jgi:hypothetical protein
MMGEMTKGLVVSFADVGFLFPARIISTDKLGVAVHSSLRYIDASYSVLLVAGVAGVFGVGARCRLDGNKNWWCYINAWRFGTSVYNKELAMPFLDADLKRFVMVI